MSDFKCVNCTNYLFTNPMQCPCGDRLCGPCYESIKSSTAKYICPLCESEIILEECFRDRAVTMELKSSIIECTNLGCSWKGKGDHFKVHLRTCKFAVIPCSYHKYGCQKQLPRSEMDIHEAKCPRMPQPAKCKEDMQNEEGHNSMVSGEQKAQTCTEISIPGILVPSTSYNSGCYRRIAEDTKPISKFIWKITDMKRRRQEANDGKVEFLLSAPFYFSHDQYGYKMCLRLYLNGDGAGKGTHISLYFTVMKGEYDAILQWPFNKDIMITLTLLDQNRQQIDLIQSFRPDPASSSFQQPKCEMNTGIGYPTFAPLSILDNNSFMKDDTMFLQCKLETIPL